MRIPGVCIECNRVRQVRVSGSAYALAAGTRQIAKGICAECENDNHDRRVGLIH